MLLFSLSIVVLLFLAAASYFTIASLKEQEPRAPKVGLAAIVLILILGGIMIFAPWARIFFAFGFAAVILFGLLFFIPGRRRARSRQGAMGYAAGEVKRFDQRDTVFSRNRSLKPGTENYRQYYEKHPEREAHDAERRTVSGLVDKIGAIDKQYRPNVEMIKISPQMAGALAPHSEGFQLPEDVKTNLAFEPDAAPSPEKIESEKASDIIKGYAKFLGADVVGI